MRPTGVIQGTLVLDAFEEVVNYRKARLHVPRWYPEFHGLSRLSLRRDQLSEWSRELRGWLDRSGVVHADLDGQLATGQYIGLAATLGYPQPETSPDVERFVDEGVVLNLNPALGWSSRPAGEPFSWSAVRMHTEGSQRPATLQPRYLMFQCVEPGSPTTGDQTVLVSMADVHARLSARQARVLSAVRLGDGPHAPPVLQASSPVFSFRDFGGDEIHWACTLAGISPGEVAEAIVGLAVAVYKAPCFGVQWARNALVVIDNRRFFHGRTRGTGVHRHLRRIRVGMPHDLCLCHWRRRAGRGPRRS